MCIHWHTGRCCGWRIHIRSYEEDTGTFVDCGGSQAIRDNLLDAVAGEDSQRCLKLPFPSPAARARIWNLTIIHNHDSFRAQRFGFGVKGEILQDSKAQRRRSMIIPLKRNNKPVLLLFGSCLVSNQGEEVTKWQLEEREGYDDGRGTQRLQRGRGDLGTVWTVEPCAD